MRFLVRQTHMLRRVYVHASDRYRPRPVNTVFDIALPPHSALTCRRVKTKVNLILYARCHLIEQQAKAKSLDCDFSTSKLVEREFHS